MCWLQKSIVPFEDMEWNILGLASKIKVSRFSKDKGDGKYHVQQCTLWFCSDVNQMKI